MRGRSLAIALPFLTLLNGAKAQNLPTPGEFSVTQQGAAHFSVPIKVPAAANGLMPELSLVYDSHVQGGELMGQGWSLSGLSKIMVCPRTFAQDGFADGPVYNSADRFCLDGERLIAVSGPYGADRTEYRTERDSFARIVSYGSYDQPAGSEWRGPHHFVVQTKSGLTMEFGNTPDSQVAAYGSTIANSMVRGWAVNKVSDVLGNSYAVTYSNLSYYNSSSTSVRDDGVFYPVRISYAAHTVPLKAAKYYVAFNYSGVGNGTILQYAGGRPVFIDRVLTSVEVGNLGSAGSTTPLYAYQINYVADKRPSSKDLPRVASIRGMTSPVSSEIPVTFTWDTESAYLPFSTATIDSAFPGTAGDYDDYFADVNGDGKKYWIRISRSVDEAWIGRLDNNGTFSPASWMRVSQLVGRGNDYVHAFADVDGDGKADWIRVKRATSDGAVALSLGNGSFAFWSASGLPVGAADQYDHMFADLNGDGRADWIRISKSIDEIALARSSGGANFAFWTTTIMHNVPGMAWKHAIADVTGGGKLDLISTGCDVANGFTVRQFNFDGLVAAENYPLTCNADDKVLFVDTNGDGIADLIRVAPPDTAAGETYGSARIALGNGSHGFTTWAQRFDFSYRPEVEPLLIDTRGDGLHDLMLFYSAYAPWRIPDSANVWRMTDGTAVSPVIEQVVPAAPRGLVSDYAADLDGDGMEDLIEVSRGSNVATVRMASGVLPKRITSIGTGLGRTINITYRPLSDPSAYSASADGAFPVLDAKGVRIDRFLGGGARLQRSMVPVVNVALDDGTGRIQHTNYSYGGLKGEVSGHGLLGFKWMKSTLVETGISAETQFLQAFPFSGLTARSTISLAAGPVIKQTTNTYGCTDLVSADGCTSVVGRRYFPYMSQTLTASWDLNGAAYPVTTTSFEFDAYGNLTHVVTAGSDGFTKTVDTMFSNDVAAWQIGRPTRSTVTLTTP